MKKILKILGILLGIVIILVLGFAAWLNFGPRPIFEHVEVKEITVDVTPESVERGAKIATMICAVCHAGDGGVLSGRRLTDAPPPFGELYALNITQHPDAGIGAWSDGELYRLFRTGVNRDGHMVYPPMVAFGTYSDEDIYSIIAFLKSDHPRVRPVDEYHPPQKPSFLLKMISKMGLNPYPYHDSYPEIPDSSDVVAFGKYLADGPYLCYYCHSASFETNDHFVAENSPGYFGGGNTMHSRDGLQIVLSANITPHPETGIGNWTEHEFRKAVMMGVRPDGSPMRDPMPKFTSLDSFEIHAIWEYLRTVPPIDNEVDRDVDMSEQ